MKRNKKLIGLILMMAILAMIAIPVTSQATASWQSKYVRFSATAGETLATGNVVCIAGTDGKAYKADSNDSALRPAVGVIGIGGSSGATVEIVAIGVITGMTTASPGARLFLSETAGAITTTGPTNAQAIGWVLPGTAGANGSTKYFIGINVPTSAGAAY